MLILVSAVLYWVADLRIKELHAYHLQSSVESSRSASEAIQLFVEDRQRLLRLFVQDHFDLIRDTQKFSEDFTYREQLEIAISSYFPDYYAYTFTDNRGNLQLDNSLGRISKMCRSEINSFLHGDVHEPQIHSGTKAHHFDVMAEIRDDELFGVFLLSFRAEQLSNILHGVENWGHQQLLVDPADNNAIEVGSVDSTTGSARYSTKLTASENKRILSRSDVPGTVWEVVDLYEPTIFSDFTYNVFVDSLIVLGLFAFVSGTFIRYLIEEDKKRIIAERAKDDFLSVMSHELRTPLTSIRGSLGLVANGVTGRLSEKSAELINVAVNNCEKMIQIVNDLLDVQKIEADRMHMDKRPLNLVSVVENAVNENGEYAKKYNVTFVFSCSHQEIMVLGDEMRLFQVMSNLLSNAAKFGKSDDEVIVILTKTEKQARVSVIDHGSGILPEFQGQVFAKFTQSNMGSSRKVGGSGLGLSIAKNIMMQHGGNVGFESQLNNGTTFFIDIPLLDAED